MLSGKFLSVGAGTFVLALWVMVGSAAYGQNSATKGPVISVDKEVHDFGIIQRGANGDARFAITNNGTEPLLISECITHCSCTAFNCPQRPIQPGETISFRVTYDTKRIGEFEKGIEIVSNAVNSDTIMLLMIGTVEE